MLYIAPEYFRTESIHKNIGNDIHNGVLSCGFMNKRTKSGSDIDIVFEHYSAVFLLSGEGTHIDNVGQQTKLFPGCFIQRIPGRSHSTYVETDGKWLEFFICFGRELFETLSNINILDSTKDVLYPGLNIAILDTFKNFMDSLSHSTEENLPFLLCEAQKIIFTIYQMHNNNVTKDTDREIIALACQLLKQPSNSNCSIQDISKQLGIGYEKFRKLFKERMGISPGSYVIQSRINNIKSTLIDSDKSIKEIALESGFPDPFTFSKQFKKLVGISPSEFKRRY